MQLLCSRTCSPSHALVGPNRTARLRLHAPPPASPRPHAVNEENAALRKAIARRRRRADRGAREGADGPELGLRSRPVLGSKTQTAPRRRCAPPALAPPCRPAAETRARSRVRRASRHASAGASLSPPPNKWCLAQSGSQCAAALSGCPTFPPASVHDWEAPAF